MDACLRDRGMLLAGGDPDESPVASRRLPEVLAQHAGTIRVLHTLRPFAVAMAGASELNSVKDWARPCCHGECHGHLEQPPKPPVMGPGP